MMKIKEIIFPGEWDTEHSLIQHSISNKNTVIKPDVKCLTVIINQYFQSHFKCINS